MRTKRVFVNKGFSLIELIVVIAVMAILVAVAVPTFAHFITRARQASDLAYMRDLERAIAIAHAEREMGEISGITVFVSQVDGSIVKIEYEEHESRTELVLERSAKTEEEKLLSEILDLDYKFKALDSVTEHPDWDAAWSIETVAPKNEWDHPDPSEYN